MTTAHLQPVANTVLPEIDHSEMDRAWYRLRPILRCIPEARASFRDLLESGTYENSICEISWSDDGRRMIAKPTDRFLRQIEVWEAVGNAMFAGGAA
ncbi:hypothetical protein [Cypionkella sp.]|uniref:hypothetical protein n=1 Tax=Cypionkella sp. TaxID=2811411 RepID=UPI002AB93E3A|nr:hypothetical protein [Cypionkella sp.]MDZ4393809.1 hypothetical protein [Cypionkella sp.]